jgi:superfamily II DNA or RNA helicase
MPFPFETGSLVEVRDERWLLTGATAQGSCSVLTLEGRDRENANQRLRVIDPFDRPRRISNATPKRRPRRAVLRAALGAIVDARPGTGLWTAGAASIDLWAYQLEPALAAINGATRLLLADAVGLGKTIQAGLLLSELRERGWIERALIVCPAGLRDTWARELIARFGIRAVILDQAAIAERVATLPAGMNPWAGHAVAIASIDFIKRAEVLAALASEPLDLLIADEAHHLTPGTDRGAAVSRVASRATWCVLLSATPHSGDQAAFDYLTNIGARGDSMTIFRRSRIDVGFATARHSHVLAVTPTADEAVLFAALERYTRAIWRERGRHDHAVRLIAVTLARRAASSRCAIERTLARRLERLGEEVAEPSQSLLPWNDEDQADWTEADALLSTPGLDSPVEERACLERLILLSRQCLNSSKLRRLGRLLDRVQEPVVIFTEYRDSLEAAVQALQPFRQVTAIHGGVPIDLRRSAVDAFNDGRFDVLVATDAAGEGINLQSRCRLIVDLELPWNPLRLEQRIGRVDRLGQRRAVHAIRMFHPYSIEQRVLEHLRLRDRRAKDALERHHVTEGRIAEAIFEGGSIEAAPPPSIATTRLAEAAGEARRVEDQRRAHQSGARSMNGLSWAAPRNGRPGNLILLARRSLANDAGAIIHEAIEPRVLSLRPLSNRRECRQLLERERELAMASPPVEAMRAGVDQGLDASRAPIHRRLLAIRADIDGRIEEQASLFDGRAEMALMARQDSIRRLIAALARTQQAIATASPTRTRVELIAAWPGTCR